MTNMYVWYEYVVLPTTWFVLLLWKSFCCYRCDAAIDVAGNAIVDAGGDDAGGVAAGDRFDSLY